MSTPRLFKHAWKVTAYRAAPVGAGSSTRGNAAYFDTLPNGLEITKLRIEYQVEKNLASEPNTCEVTITNCNEGTRAYLAQKPLVLRLDAGYEQDGGPRHLFTGDVTHAYSRRDGTEWKTIIQLGDGARATRNARVNRSFKAGTPIQTVVREVAAGMGLVVPKNIDVSPELQRQYAAGVQIFGSAADELTRLLAPLGYAWSIQDGKLQTLKELEAGPNRAHLISKDTGLIESPEYATPSKSDLKKGKPLTLGFKTLLYPQLTPGNKLDVRSSAVNGIFRADRVTHTGDSHGDEWVTEVEATPVT